MRPLPFCLLLLPWLALAQVPERLSYQGRLLKSDGTPEAGVLAMTFSLFDGPTGGSALWTETQNVAFNDGFYAVLLGEATPLPPSAFSSADRYVEVGVGGAALSPRHRIASVPFAYAAARATSLSGGAVDATSISVGGKPVVDSSGQLSANLDWSKLQNVPAGFADGDDAAGLTSVAVSAPLTGDGKGAPVSLAPAGAQASGYLTSADWARFDAKADGTHTHPVATASATGLLASSDWVAFAAKADAAHGHPAASATASGFLSAADWAAFNAKVSADDSRLTDAREPKPGSADYIQNQSGSAQSASLRISGNATAAQLVSTASGTTPPLQVASSATVTNLSADLVDGAHLSGLFSFRCPAGSYLVGFDLDASTKQLVPACSATSRSCKEIKAMAPGSPDGTYRIDPDGQGSAPAVDVYCDMTTDGGGWTRFWWYPANTTWPTSTTDALGQDFGACKSSDTTCFGRLPGFLTQNATSMLAKDHLGVVYKWDFNSANPVSNGAWKAFAQHQQVPYNTAVGAAWNPTVLAGAAPGSQQTSFMYRAEHGVASFLMDDDGCDCLTTLQAGHGMCYAGWNSAYSVENRFGVDNLADSACSSADATGPSPQNGLTLFFRER